GLDMTDEMLELAERNRAEAGIDNAHFVKGTIENIPLPDAIVDVVISNCVINLSTDKDRVLAEAFRVLRPGGRFAVADVVLLRDLEPRLMTVVELWPGRGWYTEVLAPYLRDKGKLYAAHFPAQSNVEYYQKGLAAFKAMLAANPALYDRVVLTELGPPDSLAVAPPASADAVLTFRNMHNWMGQGNDVKVMQAAFAALKPGGVLGVVEHRAAANATAEQVKDSGYMTEEMVIKAAEAAGFVLEAKSEINANPRDTRDHPKGVWTLPPSLALGDTDREKYVAIGESDRMTLRFRKPTQ
ncbi:MAG TPA: methyltransferase domain-containing protein, partial [Pseudomonadales bacterium]|nr:methyltransferase domain-containing protein [Pseudomonadales bacterium]